MSANLLDKVLEAQIRCVPWAEKNFMCDSCAYKEHGNLCMENLRKDTINMLQRVKSSRVILQKVNEETMEQTKVEILRAPTQADWLRCLTLARATQGKDDAVRVPTDEWRRKILRSGHSPIRTLMWTIRITNIPYFSSVHFCRHKIGVEHYVQSQRSNLERGAERQDAPVTHIMDINAAALMAMANKRLCGKADATTRNIMRMIADKVTETTPEIGEFLVPSCDCDADNCREFSACGQFIAWGHVDE